MTNLSRNSLTLNSSLYEHHMSFASVSQVDIEFPFTEGIQTKTNVHIRQIESVRDVFFIILLFPKRKANPAGT
jgi:hypothetical protein